MDDVNDDARGLGLPFSVHPDESGPASTSDEIGGIGPGVENVFFFLKKNDFLFFSFVSPASWTVPSDGDALDALDALLLLLLLLLYWPLHTVGVFLSDVLD